MAVLSTGWPTGTRSAINGLVRPCVWCGRALVLHAMPSLACRGLPSVRSVARATDWGSVCFAKPGFFFIFLPFVASSRHRPAGPGVSGLGPGLRGGMQCRAKPEAGYELSLYSLAGPTSMATCLLHCRPRDGEAPCTVAQRLRYGMRLSKLQHRWDLYEVPHASRLGTRMLRSV